MQLSNITQILNFIPKTWKNVTLLKKVNVEIIFEKVSGFQPTCQQMFFIF